MFSTEDKKLLRDRCASLAALPEDATDSAFWGVALGVLKAFIPIGEEYKRGQAARERLRKAETAL